MRGAYKISRETICLSSSRSRCIWHESVLGRVYDYVIRDENSKPWKQWFADEMLWTKTMTDLSYSGNEVDRNSKESVGENEGCESKDYLRLTGTINWKNFFILGLYRQVVNWIRTQNNF